MKTGKQTRTRNCKVASKQNCIAVFILSLAASLTILGLERLVGIKWDFHPDSATYATHSIAVSAALQNHPTFGFPGAGWYHLVGLLKQNIVLITTLNMIFFALANVYIYKIHKSAFPFEKAAIPPVLLLLLLNPYRLHLSTTMLKESIIILFVVIVLNKNKFSPFWAIILLLFRKVSPVYHASILPRNYFIALIFVIVVVFLLYPEILTERLDAANEVDLKARDFDNIPTFQNLGNLGAIFRGILWPILAITGAFALISPAFAFIAVAIGCVMNIAYTLLTSKRLPLNPRTLSAIGVIAVLAPAYTSFLRYAYPLIVSSPIVETITFREKNRKSNVANKPS